MKVVGSHGIHNIRTHHAPRFRYHRKLSLRLAPVSWFSLDFSWDVAGQGIYSGKFQQNVSYDTKEKICTTKGVMLAWYNELMKPKGRSDVKTIMMSFSAATKLTSHLRTLKLIQYNLIVMDLLWWVDWFFVLLSRMACYCACCKNIRRMFQPLSRSQTHTHLMWSTLPETIIISTWNILKHWGVEVEFPFG